MNRNRVIYVHFQTILMLMMRSLGAQRLLIISQVFRMRSLYLHVICLIFALALLTMEKESSYATAKLRVFWNFNIHSFHVVENAGSAVCQPRKESWRWETTNSEYGKFYVRKVQREVMFFNRTLTCNDPLRCLIMNFFKGSNLLLIKPVLSKIQQFRESRSLLLSPLPCPQDCPHKAPTRKERQPQRRANLMRQ